MKGLFDQSRSFVLFLLIVLLIFSALQCGKDASTNPKQTVETPLALHTEGRWIMNSNNEVVILRGVNVAHLEWSSDPENMLQSVQVAIDTWGANLIRLPLSQDRWFGHGEEQTDQGVAYQQLVRNLVSACAQRNAYILLELHWSNGGEWGENIGQHKMPDKNSITFWMSMVREFKDKTAVLFGLYNEPYDISWNIWKNGGVMSYSWDRNGATVQIDFDACGFQYLYDSVRGAGAENLIVIGGIDWAYDLCGVLNGYAISGENIVYDTHCYPWKSSDWDAKFGNVGRIYPLLVGEWGGYYPDNEQYAYDLVQYLRENQFSWTAWDLHPTAGPSLIQGWSYSPTWFGQLVMDELAVSVEVEE